MVRHCVVCHRKVSEWPAWKGLKFYDIPSPSPSSIGNQELAELWQKHKKWLKVLNVKAEKFGKCGGRVCSQHFILGKPSDDPDHPDYAPSVLLGYNSDIATEMAAAKVNLARYKAKKRKESMESFDARQAKKLCSFKSKRKTNQFFTIPAEFSDDSSNDSLTQNSSHIVTLEELLGNADPKIRNQPKELEARQKNSDQDLIREIKEEPSDNIIIIFNESSNEEFDSCETQVLPSLDINTIIVESLEENSSRESESENMVAQTNPNMKDKRVLEPLEEFTGSSESSDDSETQDLETINYNTKTQSKTKTVQNSSIVNLSRPLLISGVKTFPKSVQILIKEALEARELAYSPYSKFKVGAAVLTTCYKAYSGCNIETKDLKHGLCAERCAYSKAVSEGRTNFELLVIVADNKLSRFTPPCEDCLQFISEFGNVEIYLVKPSVKPNYEKVLITSVNQLLAQESKKDGS